MKTFLIHFVPAIYFLLKGSLAFSQCNANMLANGGFDLPAQTGNGNHFVGFTFNGWTTTGAQANIVRLDGSGYASGPDVAKDGAQYLDLPNSAGTVYQDFTTSVSTVPIVFGGYFSSREAANYINWTASIQIYSLPSNTLIQTSTTRNFKSQDGTNSNQETWYLLHGSVTLSPGSYRYVVNLGDFGNFDAAFANVDCVVPIRLQSFSGQRIGNTVQLNWTVADRAGVAYFEIEKSRDADHFETIDKVNASANNRYNFTDTNTGAEIFYYYRVKIVDTNGKITYSNIITVRRDDANEFRVISSHVPGNLSIHGMNGKGRVSLYDLSGRMVFGKEINAHTLDINVASLLPGIYVVHYSNGTLQQTRKFFKR